MFDPLGTEIGIILIFNMSYSIIKVIAEMKYRVHLEVTNFLSKVGGFFRVIKNILSEFAFVI